MWTTHGRLPEWTDIFWSEFCVNFYFSDINSKNLCRKLQNICCQHLPRNRQLILPKYLYAPGGIVYLNNCSSIRFTNNLPPPPPPPPKKNCLSDTCDSFTITGVLVNNQFVSLWFQTYIVGYISSYISIGLPWFNHIGLHTPRGPMSSFILYLRVNLTCLQFNRMATSENAHTLSSEEFLKLAPKR